MSNSNSDADSSTNPLAVLVGAHAESFVQGLEGAGFRVEQYGALSEIPTSAGGAAVLALAGEAHVLSAGEIDEKLRAGTVLALFKASRALLDAVYADAEPPVDAGSVELADGAPLLVYSAGGVVHIDADNADVPCEYKLRELVQNGGAAGGGPTAGLFGSMMGGLLRGRRLPY